MKLYTPKDGSLPQPADYDAEVAAAARACGIDIHDDDFERIDDLIECNSDIESDTEEEGETNG
jgi:hypothetical protein